jgi:hypothetical protein
MGASLLFFVRKGFRLVETAQGVFGRLSTHEGFFAGLEFAPVVVAVGGLVSGEVVDEDGAEEG